MKCITSFAEIVNSSTKPLILQPKILVCEEDFQAFIPPRNPITAVGNILILDFRPFLNGGINLNDYIFIWGKARVSIENLSLRTKGECYMKYVSDSSDPGHIKFNTI